MTETQALIYGITASAIDSEMLSSGRLMSPAEVAAHVYGDGQKVDPRAQGWALCGEAHPDMLVQMSRNMETTVSAQIFKVPSGASLLVLQQQNGKWAHRFVYPLVGQQAWNFVEGVRRESVITSLSSRHEKSAFITPVLLRDVMSTVERIDWSDVSIEHVAAELIASTLFFLDPKVMEGADGVTDDIEFACVTAIATDEYLSRVEAGGKATFH